MTWLIGADCALEVASQRRIQTEGFRRQASLAHGQVQAKRLPSGNNA